MNMDCRDGILKWNSEWAIGGRDSERLPRFLVNDSPPNPTLGTDLRFENDSSCHPSARSEGMMKGNGDEIR